MSSTQNYTVDLTNCDKEPIHELGQVQAFGALIAVTSDFNIARMSANIADILSLSTKPEIGDRLATVISAHALSILRDHLPADDDADAQERIFGVALFDDRRLFDVALHQSGHLFVLEIEPHDPKTQADCISVLRPILARLEKTELVEELCDIAAKEMQRLLGFDRVMVYRFHDDQSGEVVAEARNADIGSFLGLRYPKTDIPQQARSLYLRNRFRIIADVNAAPIAIEPTTGLQGEPLDLSLSTLRAVSPIHIEYLKNMGVGASLSISIIVRGKLWGLFACHHYSPRPLPYSLRTAAELFSQLFSLKLELTLAAARTRLADKGRQLHDRLMARLASGGSLVENLATIDQIIGSVIPHDGSSAFIDDSYKGRGSAPSEEEFRALIPTLNTGSTSQIISTDEISKMIPAAEAFADRAVGALVIPVSRRPRDYLVLWRRELQQVVTWAGNPDKPVESGADGVRLSPRKSFAAWQESVSGRSAPWMEEELAIAEGLRVSLLEVILRITDEAMQERSRAKERQDLLIAELNHRVRNILTLIRSLVGQSRGEASTVGEFADVIGGRIRALSMAHDNITREQWQPASLHALITAEAEAYLTGKEDRVSIIGIDALVAPEAYTVLALVLHEMMTNSAKYGALCDSTGRLEITTELNANGDYVIDWHEFDGPPVQPPTRRGFGTTIIENSIPYELRGKADIDYKPSGVEACFVIPCRYVSGNAGENSVDGKSASDSPSPTVSIPVSSGDKRHVLIVEDSMIIALDSEEMLENLGIERISVASSVGSALESIAEAQPHFALLDYNLGSESSDPVAKQLHEAGIPFYFATGYGEAMDEIANSGALGVLKKPYSQEDVAEALRAGGILTD
ncbi:HWE histidine kinase domain-containing protein [Altericroceibacterium endophyticum]|uniref:histidine kinase n=1 Tax=Altericroceibacterium endophyticum TaxID=1808508 RepID=A0A6I4T213_9SPHN|nr:HWE histidine kinase domain-containing protein [Altericroceibacterium endophyticum]MXO65274.1 GAF domain-containing protein [Altericroceibacterium endophyticum]